MVWTGYHHALLQEPGAGGEMNGGGQEGEYTCMECGQGALRTVSGTGRGESKQQGFAWPPVCMLYAMCARTYLNALLY